MAKKKKQKGALFVVISVLVAVILIPVGFLMLSSAGERSGVEFSPDDFSMRSFNYCRLPLINWTRRGIRYTNIESPGRILIDEDWIRITGRTPKRWHLVSEQSGFSSSQRKPEECDARFLTDYFQFKNSDGDNVIMKWTNNNPEVAKILWPMIATMARDRLYVSIPPLIEFAIQNGKIDDTDQFLKDFEKRVAESWFIAAKSDRARGKPERSVSRLNRSIDLDPQYADEKSDWPVPVDDSATEDGP